MNLSELRQAFRVRADDETGPASAQLWSDEEANLYLNEAHNEAADRALLIRDSTTVAVTQIAINTSSTDYALHTSILSVERVKLTSQTSPLPRETTENLDAVYPGWETQTGTPICFVEDNGRIRLVPKSSKVDTLNMIVFRLPLAVMDSDLDEPEIHIRHHYRMLDWALRCAYLKQDSEARDEQKAASYEKAFETSFGVRRDANVQRKQREHRTPVVRINW